MAYGTTGVNFDGIVDWMSRGALVGAVDSKLQSGSFWFKRNGTGEAQDILNANGDAVVRFLATDKFRVQGKKPDGTIVLNINSSNAITDTASWHHACWSLDLAVPGSGEMWIDDVDVYTETTFDDFAVDLTQDNYVIGASTVPDKLLDCCLADLWLAFGVNFSMGVLGNRRKLITADKKLVDLGSDGSIPTGTAPLIYLRGPFGDFPTNLGTGGDFAEDGGSSIANCADNPPVASGRLLLLNPPGLDGGLGGGLSL